jgi:hypothetical protein
MYKSVHSYNVINTEPQSKYAQKVKVHKKKLALLVLVISIYIYVYQGLTTGPIPIPLLLIIQGYRCTSYFTALHLTF